MNGMGCAFSHTEQIFIIDHRNNKTLRRAKAKTNNGGGMGILGHVRQVYQQNFDFVLFSTKKHWPIRHKCTSPRIGCWPPAKVGHLKSNGLHRRQRISSSSDVRFIELGQKHVCRRWMR
ncbi:hypothetical protein niasHT_004349 [Heterodera trifolii]|uniref:Uncharacterized protein n=1 Tax=Heterodera trifolii TaxID=157864 RepID=A0ABD2LT36_9BILA